MIVFETKSIENKSSSQIFPRLTVTKGRLGNRARVRRKKFSLLKKCGSTSDFEQHFHLKKRKSVSAPRKKPVNLFELIYPPPISNAKSNSLLTAFPFNTFRCWMPWAMRFCYVFAPFQFSTLHQANKVSKTEKLFEWFSLATACVTFNGINQYGSTRLRIHIYGWMNECRWFSFHFLLCFWFSVWKKIKNKQTVRAYNDVCCIHIWVLYVRLYE